MTEEKPDPYKAKIRCAINDGDMNALHRLIQEANYTQNTNWRESLVWHIVNEPYFFSFSTKLMDAQSIEAELSKRATPLLAEFSLVQQLVLLNLSGLREHAQHHLYAVVKWQDGGDSLFQDANFIDLLGRLFHQEKFSLLKEIINKTGVKLDEVKNNYTPLYYIGEGVRGVSYFRVSEPFYKPLYDIIYNYTAEKEAFLKEIGIALPTMQEANEFIAHYHQFIGHANYQHAQDVLSHVEPHTEEYKSRILHEYLQQNLNTKTMHKARKI